MKTPFLRAATIAFIMASFEPPASMPALTQNLRIDAGDMSFIMTSRREEKRARTLARSVRVSTEWVKAGEA